MSIFCWVRNRSIFTAKFLIRECCLEAQERVKGGGEEEGKEARGGGRNPHATTTTRQLYSEGSR